MLINQATLEGQFVLLEPLTEQHIKPLEKAVADGDSPKLWFASVPTAEQMADAGQYRLCGQIKSVW